MATLTPFFFDTSVILGGLIDLGPPSRRAQELMAAVAEGRLPAPLTAWHCCLEFYAVSTRLPEEYRLSPADAIRLLEEEVLGRFKVKQLPAGGWSKFLREVVRERVAGGRIYDAHIAEIARAERTRVVVTENRRHFVAVERYGIRVMSAAEFVAET